MAAVVVRVPEISRRRRDPDHNRGMGVNARVPEILLLKVGKTEIWLRKRVSMAVACNLKV